MRYFEMPKMNVSMFETENVVTVASGQAQTNEAEAQSALVTAITGGEPGDPTEAAQKIFTFNY